jgi:hypothetical protein
MLYLETKGSITIFSYQNRTKKHPRINGREEKSGERKNKNIAWCNIERCCLVTYVRCLSKFDRFTVLFCQKHGRNS